MKEFVKRSSCQIKMISEGDFKGFPLVSGFRKTKFGFQKLYARPYKNTRSHLSKSSNREFCNLFVTLTTDGVAPINTSALYYFDSKKLIINDLNLVASSNGQGRSKSGKLLKGYFGRIS